MAFKIIEQGRKPNTIWQEFICDTNDDVANLPTDCPAGSRAIVAQNGDLYLLDSTGAWNPMPRGGGGGGSSNVVANPILSGGEPSLTGLEVDGDKYKVPEVRALIYDSSTLEMSDLFSFYYGLAIPVLVDYNTGDYVLGTCLDNNKVAFNAIKIGEGKLVRYTYMLGDQNPWNKEEIPLGMLAILYCEPNSTPFSDIVQAAVSGMLPVIFSYDDYRYYYCGKIEMSDGDPVAVRFYTNDGGQKSSWSVDYQDNWTQDTITSDSSIYFVEPNNTTFMGIVEAVSDGKLPVINDIANGRTYYVSGYTMSGSDPVAIRFCTLEKDDSGLRYTWTVDYQDNWTNGSYTDGLYYVVPGTTTFMDIVGLLTKCTQPVINDTVNGRAYYISDYTMVGGQPAAITFSTIGANTPHTWTVDYQDNWTST